MRVENGYGIHFAIPNLSDIDRFVEDSNPKHKTDVLISINGIKKKYTYKDFLDRLGFDLDEYGIFKE